MKLADIDQGQLRLKKFRQVDGVMKTARGAGGEVERDQDLLQFQFRFFSGSRPRHQHRTRGLANDPFRRAAEKGAFPARPAVGGENDEVRLNFARQLADLAVRPADANLETRVRQLLAQRQDLQIAMQMLFDFRFRSNHGRRDSARATGKPKSCTLTR